MRLNPSRLQFSAAALLGALVSAGYMNDAAAIVAIDPCGLQHGDHTSRILSDVQALNGGGFQYNFTACNTSALQFDPETERPNASRIGYIQCAEVR